MRTRRPIELGMASVITGVSTIRPTYMVGMQKRAAGHATIGRMRVLQNEPIQIRFSLLIDLAPNQNQKRQLYAPILVNLCAMASTLRAAHSSGFLVRTPTFHFNTIFR